MASNKKRSARPGGDDHSQSKSSRMTRSEAARRGVIFTSAEETRRAHIQEIIEQMKVREEEERIQRRQEEEAARESRRMEEESLREQRRISEEEARETRIAQFQMAGTIVHPEISTPLTSQTVGGWNCNGQSPLTQSILLPLLSETSFLCSAKWHIDLVAYTIKKLLKCHAGSGIRSARVLMSPNMWKELFKPLALSCNAVQLQKRIGRGRHPDAVSFRSFSHLENFFSISMNASCLTFRNERPPYKKNVHISDTHDFQLIYCDKVIMAKFWVFKTNETAGFMGVV